MTTDWAGRRSSTRAHLIASRPERWVLAGNQCAQAVVRIVAVDDDGQVHFTILPGSVAKNRHLLGGTVA
jgi:hypothetical protein